MIWPRQAKTATPTANRGGGEIESIRSGFHSDRYRSPHIHSIPSAERSGCLSLVVARGDRLFAVGYVRESVR